MNAPHWIVAQDGEPELRAMYERHYTCRIYRDGRKPKKFIGPGEYVCLTTPSRDALFVWRKFRDASGQQGVNCAIFRNEGKAVLSSDLIREADAIADFCWPGERHYTLVFHLRRMEPVVLSDEGRTRHSGTAPAAERSLILPGNLFDRMRHSGIDPEMDRDEYLAEMDRRQREDAARTKRKGVAPPKPSHPEIPER